MDVPPFRIVVGNQFTKLLYRKSETVNRNVPRGVKGHNMNDKTLPGRPAHTCRQAWAGLHLSHPLSCICSYVPLFLKTTFLDVEL